MFSLTLNQVLKMCLLLAIGFIASRRGLVSEEGNRTLSNVLLLIVNPLLIMQSFLVERTPELTRAFFISALMSICVYAIMIPVGMLLFSAKRSAHYSVEQFSAVYPNCGFMGIPLINALLGSRGVLLLAPFMGVFNVLVWTHGLLLMTGSTSRKQLRKGLTSPVIFGILIGIFFFLTGLSLPPLLTDTISSISAMNTPMAMLVAGIALAQSNLKKALLNPRLYLVTGAKLVLIPLLLLLIFARIPVPSDIACVNLIGAACPAATTCTMFALRYHKDYHYASEIFAFSTLLSMVTIPAYVFWLERVIL